jgi:uncharacterized protein
LTEDSSNDASNPLKLDDFSSKLSDQQSPSLVSRTRRIFFGPDGLRAGWSILIYVILVFSLFRIANFALHYLHLIPPPAPKGSPAPPTQPLSPHKAFLAEGVPFFMIVVATWIMSKIEHRPNSTYGFGGHHRLSHFFAGLIWGVTSLSILVLTLWKIGLLSFDARLLFGSDAIRYGFIWLTGFLLVALLEEYLLRGYLQFTLARGLSGVYGSLFQTPHRQAIGFWTAAFILSFLFGLGHGSNPSESPIGLLSAGLVGLIFCLTLWRTGSLWWAIGFHTSWDWAQSFLYGVADSGTMVQFHLLGTHPIGKPLLSGGATGPEGSVLILPIMALMSAAIILSLPQEKSRLQSSLAANPSS